MGDYKLWYFVEGKDNINKVIISRNEDVAQLREEIHKKCSRGFWDDVEAMDLVLLKVDIDPTPHKGAILELRAPDSAIEMDPMQEINEIWPVQPNQRHLHICVRLYRVLSQEPCCACEAMRPQRFAYSSSILWFWSLRGYYGRL
ncbi:hypothetical protein EDB87DRAFT_1252066 [Lactarius vividus]|nr:hypothetical protein EDB87DRAFT_1252066 [Lactarius vividus]